MSPTEFHWDESSLFVADAMTFLNAQADDSIDLLITDPAYSGMNQHLKLGRGRIVGNYSQAGEKGRWFKEFHDEPEQYRAFLQEVWRVLRPNSHIYIMFDSFSLLSLGALVREFFNVKNVLTWDKVNMGMGHYFRRQTEFIVFAAKGKRSLTSRALPDLWRIKRIHRATYPTQKPVALFEAMITASRPKDVERYLVCDPFFGSGSSAMASLKQNSDFIGADISPNALGIASTRIQTYLATSLDPLEVSRAQPDQAKRGST